MLTRFSAGLCPYTPQKCAGIQIEPARSDPIVRQPSPAATARAPPPVEPPGVRATSHGLFVAPWIGLLVCQSPSITGTFVLPTTMAPEASTPSTATAGAEL